MKKILNAIPLVLFLASSLGNAENLETAGTGQIGSGTADIKNPKCVVFVPAELCDLSITSSPFNKGGREPSEMDDDGDFWENKKHTKLTAEQSMLTQVIESLQNKGYTLLPIVTSIQSWEYFDKHSDRFPIVTKQAFNSEKESVDGFEYIKPKFDFYIDNSNKKCAAGESYNACALTEKLLDNGAQVLVVTRIASKTKELERTENSRSFTAKESIRSNFSFVVGDMKKAPNPTKIGEFQYKMNQFAKIDLSTQQVDSTFKGDSNRLCLLSGIAAGKLTCPQPSVTRKINSKHNKAGLANFINNIAPCN